MHLLLLIIFLGLNVAAASRPKEEELSYNNYSSAFPIVCISDGCIEGRAMNGYLIEECQAFFNIPYAEPPIGNLRFANPVPKGPWHHLLDGKLEQEKMCAHKNLLKVNASIEGVEDCLYLAIFRPFNVSAANNSSIPVIVYLHEGSYFGASTHNQIRGPQYFMDTQKVIFVIVTYRLGVLGFLSTGDEASPGNYGLKDQVLALRWVKNNIKAFGGDPDNVTLMGSSFGAISAHLHMISSTSADLFQRAILMSGTINGPFSQPMTNALALAKRQAEIVGIENIDGLNSIQLVERLRQVNVSVLVDSIDELKEWYIDPLITFNYVIEPDTGDAFITEKPASKWAEGDFRQIPWMAGFVPVEGTIHAAVIVANPELLNAFNAHIDMLLPIVLELKPDDSSKLSYIIKRLRDFYLNGDNRIDNTNSHGFIDMYTHRFFHHPLYKTIEQYLSYANVDENPVYLYKFAYNGNLSHAKVFTGTERVVDVGHTDDLIYLFRSPLLFPEFKRKSFRAPVIQVFVDMFVDFAVNGKPKAWNTIENCKPSNGNNICDYLEFRNMNNDFNNNKMEMRSSHVFNLEMIDLWNEINSL